MILNYDYLDEMKTHFLKIRRLMAIRSILCPAFILFAYFAYIYSCQWLAIILSALCFLVYSAFPNKNEEDPEYFEDIRVLMTYRRFKAAFSYIPYIFFSLWIVHHIEFMDMVERLLTAESLGDFRMIIAMIGWSILWGTSNYRKVSELSDADVIEIYESYEVAKGNAVNEQD